MNAFVQDVHLEKRPADFKMTNTAELTAWYRSRLETPTARAWIAYVDGLPVGYVLAVVSRRSDNPFSPARLWWEVDEIAVDPQFRRRGRTSTHSQSYLEAKTCIVDIVTSWAFNLGTRTASAIGFVPKTVLQLSKSAR